jgi:hypothetical protein
VHELCHGLGFLTFINLTSGAKLLGFDGTFMLNLERYGANPPDYPSMTNAQRVAASTDTGNLHWVGDNVEESSGVLTTGKVGNHVRMLAPNPQQPGSSVSHWDTVLAPHQIMEPTYTGPLHNPVLELPLFQDIRWTLLTSPPRRHHRGTCVLDSQPTTMATTRRTSQSIAPPPACGSSSTPPLPLCARSSGGRRATSPPQDGFSLDYTLTGQGCLEPGGLSRQSLCPRTSFCTSTWAVWQK